MTNRLISYYHGHIDGQMELITGVLQILKKGERTSTQLINFATTYFDNGKGMVRTKTTSYNMDNDLSKITNFGVT